MAGDGTGKRLKKFRFRVPKRIQAAPLVILRPRRCEKHQWTCFRRAQIASYGCDVFALPDQSVRSRIASYRNTLRLETKFFDVQIGDQRGSDPRFVIFPLHAKVFRIEPLERNAMPNIEETDIRPVQQWLHDMQSMIADDCRCVRQQKCCRWMHRTNRIDPLLFQLPEIYRVKGQEPDITAPVPFKL